MKKLPEEGRDPLKTETLNHYQSALTKSPGQCEIEGILSLRR